MAQQRHALAGPAHTGASAGEITTCLNELVCSDPTGQTATVVVGHLDEDKVLHWADAGHPAPLLLRDGRTEPLETGQRGPLLGAPPGDAYETSSPRVRPGDLLVLCTDGMVERRGEDVAEGIARLARAVAAAASLQPQDAVDAPLADPEIAGHEDGACVLGIRVD
ncbi:PP2C family protein-serine/threonine phosphatase [Streptomyces sp. NPDC059556]|uniref:PP2C family protein-serine/threonine phosphatase n=1 Tax=Streptomyces sp. NPDC059556 TaxID=3346863 RepID=UPI003677577B